MARTALTGTRIRERRIALQIRQADLARAAGISPAYLNLIEHNRRRVGETLLAGIAAALGAETVALSEGGTDALYDALREAASAPRPGGAAPADPAPGAPPPAETDRIEEFVGRYPGWAAVLAERQMRIAALERTIETYSERMAQDPYLADTLHEVLSCVTSLRSTAAILEEEPDIAPQWRARFVRTIHEESLRLSHTAEALVGYLDTMEEAETGLSSPQEEVEAWLAGRGWRIAEAEAGPVPPGALTAHVPELASAAARELAEAEVARARQDAAALPAPALWAALRAQGAGRAGLPDPLRLADALGVPLDLLFRRLCALGSERAGPDLSGPDRSDPEPPEPDGPARAGAPQPPRPALPPLGLVACDASGALTYRRPLPGFTLPRFGAACPLWPLYDALARPGEPIRAVIDVAGRMPQRFLTYSIGRVERPQGFAGPVLRRAAMLVLPAGSEDMAPARPAAGTAAADAPRGDPADGGRASASAAVGTSCRICPRPACPARREPSILRLA